MISGTNGLLGAADGGFILRKEKRTSNAATLEVSGRDQPDQKIYLNRNPETLIWELEKTETELWKQLPDPLLERLIGRPIVSYPAGGLSCMSGLTTGEEFGHFCRTVK